MVARLFRQERQGVGGANVALAVCADVYTANLQMQNRFYSEERERDDQPVIVWLNPEGDTIEQIKLRWLITYLSSAFKQDEWRLLKDLSHLMIGYRFFMDPQTPAKLPLMQQSFIKR